MIVNHKEKYLFISTPKIGTNSLYSYLQKLGGVRFGGFHETRDIFPAEYFRFTTCRDPYQKALSAWWSTCMRDEMQKTDRYEFRRGCESYGLDPGRFADWLTYVKNVQHNHSHITVPQYKWHRQFHLDRVLRIESINEDIQSLPFNTSGPVGKENETTQHKSQYLSDEAIDLINEIYAEDFRIYGYHNLR